MAAGALPACPRGPEPKRRPRTGVAGRRRPPGRVVERSSGCGASYIVQLNPSERTGIALRHAPLAADCPDRRPLGADTEWSSTLPRVASSFWFVPPWTISTTARLADQVRVSF